MHDGRVPSVRDGSKQTGSRILPVLILVLTGIWTVIHLPYGMHLDELLFLNYGVSALKGMRLVTENYAPYQFGEIIQYPFVKLLYLIRGDLTGLALYMRYVYTFIQLALGIRIYLCLRERSKYLAFFLAYLHFLYRYHWPTINYKALLYWGTIILILSLYDLSRTGHKRYVVFLACGIMVAAFGNPYAVLLYPAAIFILAALKGKEARTDMAILTGVCAAGAALLIGTLMALNGPARFLKCLPLLFSDGTGGHSLFGAGRITRLLMPVVLIAVLENAAAFGAERLSAKKGKRIPWGPLLAVFYLALLLIACFAKISSAGPSRFWYILLAIFLLSPFLFHVCGRPDAEKRTVFLLCTCPSIAMILTIILSTNQGLAVVSYGCMPGLLGLIALYWEDEAASSAGTWLCRLIAAMMVFMFLFYVPEDGSANILQKRVRIDGGPLAGIFANEEMAAHNDAICDVVSRYTDETDSVLIIGDARESLIGLMAARGRFGDKPGGFDREREAVEAGRNLVLYEMNPEYVPSVVIVDTDYADKLPYLAQTDIWSYVSNGYARVDGYGKYEILR